MRSRYTGAVGNRALIVVIAFGLSGCVMAQIVPEAQGKYAPSGEMVFGDITCSFDGARVRNEQMNLSRRTDGTWIGTFQDRPIDVSVSDTHVRGPDLVLAIDRNGDVIDIAGQWHGRSVRYQLSPAHFSVRTRSHTFELDSIAPGSYGSTGELDLRGEAAQAAPPWPQIGFALLAMFN
jgi:hypothetical protein